MARSHKMLGFLLVVTVGAWGCSKSPGGGGEAERSPSQEGRAKRLEEDFRAAASARDQFRLKFQAAEERLAAAERRAGELQSRLDQTRSSLAATTADRDAVRAERDTLSAQYDEFRKGIRNLLGQAETTLNNSKGGAPTVTVGAQLPPAGPPAPNR